MTNQEIVRSWKDEDHLLNLSSQERAFLPDNPAGLIELTDDELVGVEGGSDSLLVCMSLAAASMGAIASLIITALTHRGS
jgi:mersacidin/lichenicidin family type 2 lantibiotic